MITLKNLVKTAPFDEETRGVILSKIEKNELDENQKFQMSSLCWDMITTLFETELKIKFDGMMMEVAEGKSKYTQTDYINEKNKLMQEYAQKLEEVQSGEAIEEVKKQLDIHTHKQTPN